MKIFCYDLESNIATSEMELVGQRYLLTAFKDENISLFAPEQIIWQYNRHIRLKNCGVSAFENDTERHIVGYRKLC